MEENSNWEKLFKNKLGITEKEYLDNIPNINKEEYSHQNKCISVDVPRTINNPEISSNLAEILKVFSITNGGLGYISGMSYIVKALLDLTNNDKIKTYIIMRNIFQNEDLLNLYNNNNQNVMNKLEVKFGEKIPLLFQHFKKNNIDLMMLSISLLKSLFCYEFDENIAKELLKIFIIKNDFVLYLNTFLAILKINEEELLKKNFEGIIVFINNYKAYDVNKFFEIIKKLND